MEKVIGLVGTGFVGTAFLEGMRHAYDIFCYDKQKGQFLINANEKQGTSFEDPLCSMVDQCELIFVCLPTPMKEDGSCDTSIVEGVVEQIYTISKQLTKSPVVVIKSTIVPGTTQKLNDRFSPTIQCVFNPEFLREATYIQDFKNQDRIIIGGPRPGSNVVKEVYQHAYPDVPTVKTCSTTAEMVKYLTNCFLAVKVSFANEIAQLCDQLKIDYDKVVEYATKDQRLGKSHWAVPGPMLADDGSGKLLKGFGGSCFCKDINALIALAKEIGVDPKVMNAAWDKNLEVRPEKDWLYLKGRAVTN